MSIVIAITIDYNLTKIYLKLDFYIFNLLIPNN
jgi:hypothetical protein